MGVNCWNPTLLTLAEKGIKGRARMRGCKLLHLQDAKNLPKEFYKRKFLTGAVVIKIMEINRTPLTLFLMLQSQKFHYS